MNKILRIIGYLLIGLAILFFFIFSFIVIKDPAEPFVRDLFGLTIPQSPIWISFIPYLGSLLNLFFELFSIHGLVQLTVSITLYLSGISLINKAKR